jgi:hypothetical protein
MTPRHFFATVLACVTALAGCASIPESATNVRNFDQSGTGSVEFYCASCVTGWVVYEMRDGREERILNLKINRRAQDLLHNPVRMRRAGIAYPPGEFDFLIRVPHSMFRSQHISERIHVSVTQGVIIPVRIDAHKQTEITYEWTTTVGPPLPVADDAAGVERLLAALTDPDWGVRWYAAEAIGRIKGDIGEALRTGLESLAADEAYERCLEREATVPCSLVSEQAQNILRSITGPDSAPP